MNTKAFAVILALLSAAAVLYMEKEATPVSSEFQAWKHKFAIKYDNDFQNQYRERIYLENAAKINAHNANEFKTYKKGINKFTALTQQEFVQIYLGTIVSESSLTMEQSSDDISVGDVDWVAKGAVTDIKDQGQCGSCWAFSTTGSLEGLSFLSNGQLESFSEQQLVDCSFLKYGNLGCNGGQMDNGFKFVRDNGIVHESEYGYVAKLQACKIPTGPFKISGFTDIKSCSDLANAVTGRPVSVAVDATNWSHYESGVFSDCQTKLNHGVLLVGVSDQSWKVKNSWSSAWGEQGFIKLARGNTCGICNVASYPNK